MTADPKANKTTAMESPRLLPDLSPYWIMGVLNCTPDSFYDGGARSGSEAHIAYARRLIADGADMIDVGGESTRPGSDPVPVDEQIRRTAPVIAGIRAFWDGPISIDTTCTEVARAAAQAGANWINDISALRDDPPIVFEAVSRGMGLILMHMQGTPRTMQEMPVYTDIVEDVAEFLEERAGFAHAHGVAKGRIIIDPGIGFGKTATDNLVILHHLDRLVSTGYPVLVGASRKSFIGHVTGDPVPNRLEGSLAAAVCAYLAGARILRVHDVGSTRRVLQVAAAIANSPNLTSA